MANSPAGGVVATDSSTPSSPSPPTGHFRRCVYFVVVLIVLILGGAGGYNLAINQDLTKSWHLIEAIALSVTFISIVAGVIIVGMDLETTSKDGKCLKKDVIKFHFWSGGVIIVEFIICYITIGNLKNMSLHAFLFSSVFAILAIYEWMMGKILSEENSIVRNKLNDVFKYCDLPATVSFFLIALSLLIVDHTDSVAAMAGGAFGLHMLISSFIVAMNFTLLELELDAHVWRRR